MLTSWIIKTMINQIFISGQFRQNGGLLKEKVTKKEIALTSNFISSY